MTTNRSLKTKAREHQATTGGTYAGSLAAITDVYNSCLITAGKVRPTAIVSPSEVDASRPSYVKSAANTWHIVGATGTLTDADIAQVMTDNRWGKTYRVTHAGWQSSRNYDKVSRATMLFDLADEAEASSTDILTPDALRQRADEVIASLDIYKDGVRPDARENIRKSGAAITERIEYIAPVSTPAPRLLDDLADMTDEELEQAVREELELGGDASTIAPMIREALNLGRQERTA